MHHIEKRQRADGGVSYRARVKYRGRILVSTHRDRAKAERWAAEKGAEIRDDAHFAGEACRRRALSELIDRYIEHVLSAKRDARNPKRQLLWWKDHLGTMQVGSVTRATISECRDELLRAAPGKSKARSPATVVRYLAALSHVFSVAINDWEWAETNPVKGVRKPKEPRGRDRYLSDAERERLLAECRKSKSADLYAFVVLALCTGARRGEIASLEWGDVDLTRRVVVLQGTKNGTTRSIPLSGPALDALKARYKVRSFGSKLVFPGADPQIPVDLTKPWHTAMRRAEIVGFRFHDLRHSAASYLAMDGASALEIAAILGHKTLQMTKRYSHLSVDHLAEVMERVNGKVFANA
jgi:integrase